MKLDIFAFMQQYSEQIFKKSKNNISDKSKQWENVFIKNRKLDTFKFNEVNLVLDNYQ